MRSYQRSSALWEETKQHLAGGVSSNIRYASVPVPLFFERGEGARLYDVDGNVTIDYILGNGPAILGHAPPDVLRALSTAMKDASESAAMKENLAKFASEPTYETPEQFSATIRNDIARWGPVVKVSGFVAVD